MIEKFVRSYAGKLEKAARKCSLFHRLKKNVNKIYGKIFLDRENYF